MSKALLQRILDLSIEGVAIIGEDQRIEYANDAWTRTTGSEGADLVGQRFTQYHSPESESRIRHTFADVLSGKTGESHERVEAVFPDGRRRTIEITMELVTLRGGLRKVVARGLDVSDWAYRGKALEESETRYQALVEAMNDGFAIDDSDGRLVYVNNALCRMLGLERKDLLGREWHELTINMTPQQVKQKISARKKGESERYELLWKRSDGVIVPSIVSATPHLDRGRRFLGTFAVVTEISDQKDTEETIQFYIDLLTHDITNQLQVIMTSTGLLDEELPKSYLEDAKRNILDAVERCSRLITKVKRAGELKTIPAQVVDLAAVLSERAKVLERVYDAKVHTTGLGSPIWVRADILLGELLWNLLENSARHNPKSSKEVWVTAQTTGTEAIVEIADNGPGISDARKEALFDKSRRTAGVGLTLVNQMARKYGGRIEVGDRVPGTPRSGAKFTLILKRAQH